MPDRKSWPEPQYHTTASKWQQRSYSQNQLIVMLDYREQCEDTIHTKKNLLQLQFMIGELAITNQLDIVVLSPALS